VPGIGVVLIGEGTLLLHELSHARYLTDVYRFDFPLQTQNSLQIRNAAGMSVFDPGDPFDPSLPLHAFAGIAAYPFLYANQEDDIMSCVCAHLYGPYDAVVLNRASASI